MLSLSRNDRLVTPSSPFAAYGCRERSAVSRCSLRALERTNDYIPVDGRGPPMSPVSPPALGMTLSRCA